MSFLGLINQTITIYTKSSYNAYGREVVGSGSTASARVQPTTRRKLLANGNIVTIEAIAYVAPDTSVNTDDRITFDSNEFKVYSKYPVPDSAGNTHHIKLELIKWRQT